MTAHNSCLRDFVAPLTGAWIETKPKEAAKGVESVAPLTGAWIETGHELSKLEFESVAPLTGAWIETPIFRGYHSAH